MEYIVTQQWFIRVLDHKDVFLQAGEDITWRPHHMKARYREWVEGLHWDWCVSRQRYYRRPHSRLVLRWMRRGSAAGRLAATRRPDNHEPARAMLVLWHLVGHPGDRRAGHLGHLILLPPDRRP